MTLAEPGRLSDLLFRGQFDAALVPVAEVLAHDRYDLLDGVAIASDGRVDSVILAHREPVEKLTRVAVTPDRERRCGCCGCCCRPVWHPARVLSVAGRDVAGTRGDVDDWR